MEDFNWSSAIGPGTTHLSMTAAGREEKFMKALQELPEIQMNNDAMHPNRYEEAGNCMAGKGVGAHVTEKHGIGAKETPATTSPELYWDRFEHQNVTKAIMLIEAALINSAPDMSNEFVAVSFSSVLTGRARDLVEKAYIDVGWSGAKILALDLSRSTIKLEF